MLPDKQTRGISIQQHSHISILLVDSQPIVRYGISHLIEREEDMVVIAATDVCHAAWEVLGKTQPDVLLIDVPTKDRCANKLIEKITEERLITRTLVYTSQSAEWQVLEAIRSGATGYITKDAEPGRLIDAIRVVARGGSYLDASLSGLVMGHVGRKHERRDANNRQLTRRESLVLEALANGMRNREIAKQMSITERTVKYHVTSVFQKMRVKNRTEAVRLAVEKGFI
jgi:DNA-binding NarL/FixJ family response regulator